MLECGPKLVANPEHLELLRQGVGIWIAWRAKEPSIVPDLTKAELSGANLSGANLRGANLSGAELSGSDLSGADLSGACLNDVYLGRADLSEANLRGAFLHNAYLGKANLDVANLSGADLSEANLDAANLSGADLSEANLSGAFLKSANLTETDFCRANLAGANLDRALLVETDLVDAILTDCRIYGISAWDVKLGAGTIQQGLIVTPEREPVITVDDLEVAQFVYLLLHNEKIRDVIDTITSKVVLILGRFSIPARKTVLNALRDELRKRNYAPVVFDFEKPTS
jgi:Pentapeptide repeats (8 copies)